MKSVIIIGDSGAPGVTMIKKCVSKNCKVLVNARSDSAKKKHIPVRPLV